jgi:hypothetical protein
MIALSVSRPPLFKFAHSHILFVSESCSDRKLFFGASSVGRRVQKVSALMSRRGGTRDRASWHVLALILLYDRKERLSLPCRR